MNRRLTAATTPAAGRRHPRHGERISLRLWGVRGSLPTPGPATVRYGGDTICFELIVGGNRVVVDCGSGGRALGRALMAEGPLDFDILFTHSHLDHVCGLPFFKPAYHGGSHVRLWAGHLKDANAHREAIERLMSPPLFPVKPTALTGCRFRQFHAGETIVLPCGLAVDTIALNHPGGSTGYRFSHDGAVVCVITDHEHGVPEIDAAVTDFVRGADVMLYDAAYTDADYGHYRGWGHSTWEEGISLATRAGVRLPVMIHHDIYRTDEALDEIQAAAQRLMPGVVAGFDGMLIKI
ncbi:MBL fold metallo-hydrolase [Pseudoxanthobacter sp.]|uniref:MBL fold metallo-hydrolase n=1 Tax=Pseudoxanthobacter sp. TaxID=1925742 RepID=UPI002FE33547